MKRVRSQESRKGIVRFVAISLIITLCSFVKFQSTRIKIYKTFSDTSFQAGDLVRISPLKFNPNKPTLVLDSTQQVAEPLRAAYQFLQKFPYLVVEVGNHSDYRTPTDYSVSLTRDRAQTCVDSLVKMGISVERLVAKGYNNNDPYVLQWDILLHSGRFAMKGSVLTEAYIKSFNDDKSDVEALKSLNSRTELKIIGTDYKPTSGN